MITAVFDKTPSEAETVNVNEAFSSKSISSESLMSNPEPDIVKAVKPSSSLSIALVILSETGSLLASLA